MRSGEPSRPEPLSPAPLACHRLLGQSQPDGIRASAFLEYGQQIKLKGNLSSDLGDIVHDIFKEDLLDRAQARRYLWEFFD